MDARRIILIDFDDQFFLDIAMGLIDRGVEIPFIVADLQDKYKHECFKKTKILDPVNYFYPRLISKLNKSNKESLSGELIKDFVGCENQFLAVSDRLSYFPLSVHDRRKIYQDLLLYWHTLLKNNPVDAVVFASTPHMGYQNIIYYVAKKLNISTYYLQRTLIENRVLILENYHKVSKIPPEYLADRKKKEMIDLIGKDDYNKIFVPSIWLKRSSRVNRKILNKDVAYLFREFVKVIYNFLFKFMFNENLPSAFYFNDKSSKIRIGLASVSRTINTYVLKSYYQKHSSTISLKRRFVFFPLHFQPERSTVPEGGAFDNQLLVLDILSKSLPKDWIIYVKEHPSQFRRYDLRKKHYRNIDYYKRILAYRNVRLVDLEKDSSELIEKAIFTVTVTGSAGWQSLLKGKPCMAFGNPWYAACRSCHIVDSIESCKRAIDEIVKERSAEVEMNVLRFLAYYKNIFIHSSNGYWFAQQSDVPYQKLVDNLVSGIIKKCR
jgi:hypothetical protein